MRSPTSMPLPALLHPAAPSRVNENAVSAIGAAGLAAVLIAVGSRHEAWFDEAQAWLLARDSALPDLLIHRLHYEGTPGLWHMLLWLASHAGYPFLGLWLISSAIALSGAFVVLRTAPFPVWLRLGIIGSYFFAYQYSIVARSYALDLLLVPLAAFLFRRRTTQPMTYAVVLGLLANANAHSFMVAGTLYAEAILLALRTGNWRQPAFYRSTALFVFLALCAILQAWPASDVSFNPSDINFDRASRLIREAFVDRVGFGTHDAPLEVQKITSVLILLPSLILFRRAGTFILTGSLALSLLVFSALQPTNVWHSGILFLVWIFGLWISWSALNACSRSLRGLVLMSVAALVLLQDAQAAAAWIREVREPYSSGREAAAIVRAARERDPALRVAAVGFKAFSVQPWFAHNVFANYDGGPSRPAFYVWQRQQPFSPSVELGTFRTAVAGRYGLIALSTHLSPGSDLRDYVSAGSENGYCPTARVSGHLIWKAYRLEDDGILFFERCPTERGAAG
jgi:hypothetical protein